MTDSVATRIPEPEFGERRARLAAVAIQHGLDGVLVAGRSSGTLDNMGNVHWLTRHYHVPPIVTPTGPWTSYGIDVVLVTSDARSALIATGISETPVIDETRTGLDLDALLIAALHDLGLSSGRLGLAGSAVLPWSLTRALDRQCPKLGLVPFDLELAKLRLTLSEAECGMVRQSGRIGAEILTAALEAVMPGATDGDVAAAGWNIATRQPRTQHWNFIIAGGQRVMEYAAGSLPSWDAETPYRLGDLVHPDCYGYVDGYMYDVQRTVVVGDSPTSAQRDLHARCAEMVDALAEALRDGVTCREIHAVGHQFLKTHAPDDLISPWGDTFDHFGHGYASGFDWPWLGSKAPGSDSPMVAPFAVTIELWWGRPQVGAVLLEDNFLVHSDGVENVTASVPRTLIL